MHKFFTNSAWMLADKLVRLFPGIVVLAMIARYIGPEYFGVWNFAMAITAIIGGLAVLGLDKTVVKEVVAHPERTGTIIATALGLRLAAGLLAIICCLLLLWMLHRTSVVYVYCTFISGVNVMLQAFDVFDYYYQAKGNVQKVAVPKLSVFLLFCGLKVLFIALHCSFISLVWLSCAELVVTYLVIYGIYRREEKNGRLLIRFSRSAARTLLTEGWPIIFTGMVVLLYMKIDQVLLNVLASPVQQGEYAAAARISELWYTLPTVLAAIILPVLIQQRMENKTRYLQTVEKCLRLSFWASLLIAVLVSFAAGFIIRIMYGTQYVSSGAILSIHIWASIPIFVGMVVMTYLIAEGDYKVNLYATSAGLVVKTGLILLLIPFMGGIGAAVATVVSYITVYGVALLLDKTGESRMMSVRMLLPWRAAADVRQVFDAFKVFIAGMVPAGIKKTMLK